MDCIFCKILAGEIPCKKVFENEHVLAFHDIAPAAPTHVLVIPKRHIGGLDDLTPENVDAVARVFEVVPKIAAELNLTEGYRVVSNCGEHGGQTVPHLHFHVLGGQVLGKMA